jgi:hypothetical protein
VEVPDQVHLRGPNPAVCTTAWLRLQIGPRSAEAKAWKHSKTFSAEGQPNGNTASLIPREAGMDDGEYVEVLHMPSRCCRCHDGAKMLHLEQPSIWPSLGSYFSIAFRMPAPESVESHAAKIGPYRRL